MPSKSRHFKSFKWFLALAALAVMGPSLAFAQDGPAAETTNTNANRPMFGAEFEFAGQGNRVPVWENQKWENYEKLMRIIAEAQGGRASEIKKVTWEVPHPTKEGQTRTLFRAEWTDSRGKKWLIEPEYVSSKGLDGYEVVTPPMEDSNKLREILDKIRNSGLVREGAKSGVHVHVDGRRLITPNGNATGLINLINMHENYEPLLRRLFNPVRGGGYTNYFAQPLYVNHSKLLNEISQLPEGQRTQQNLERIFRNHQATEMKVHGMTELDANAWKKMWKYNNLNLKNILNINEALPAEIKTVEFRMNDLSTAETHRLQIELYRKMVERAAQLAAEGKTVKYERPADFTVPKGVDPARMLTPNNPAEARAQINTMLESLGLNPAEYKALLDKNVARSHKYSEKEMKERVERLPRGVVESNGKAFTYGFELEGRGSGFALIGRPTDAAMESRWDAMSNADKRAYYERVVGQNHSSVKTHFKLDTARFPYLDGSMKVEASGNWEIRSNVFNNVGEATDKMREVKKLTGKSAKGFHLHMRDNAPKMELLRSNGNQLADFMKRAGLWVFMERVASKRTDLSLKSWSNAPFTPSTLDGIANMNPSNFNRHTLRFQKLGDAIDVEIRGLTLDVNRIETLAKIITENLRTQNFGPWKHSENRIHHNGQGEAPAETKYLPHVEKYLKNVEGLSMNPELKRIVENMQKVYPDASGKKTRALPSNLGLPLANWEGERSLSEPQRRIMTFAREDYLRDVLRIARNIEAGKYGFDVNIANSSQLQKTLGLTEAEANRFIEFRRANGQNFTNVESMLKEFLQQNARGHGDITQIKGNSSVQSLQNYGLSKFDAKLVDAVRKGVNTKFGGDVNNAELKLGDANAKELRQRLGLTEAQAKRFAEVRGIARFSSVEAMVQQMSAKMDPRQGLSRVNIAEATTETLQRLGTKNNAAATAIKIREAINGQMEGKLSNLNYNEIERHQRLKVKKWAETTQIGKALYNTLLPRPPASEAPGEGFAKRRRAIIGAQEMKISSAEVLTVFESMREAMAEQAKAEGRNASRVRSAQLEIVRSGEMVLEYNAKTNKIQISESVLYEIHNRSQNLPPEQRRLFRRKAMGIFFGHELAHSSGIKAEAKADIASVEALKNARGVGNVGGVEIPVTKAEIKETLRVFERPTGSKMIDNITYRLRQLPRYGFVAGREANLNRAATGQADPLGKFRRADGTVNWAKAGGAGALSFAKGSAHFALALFLKELAVVVQTGDRARIDEFFDGLMTIQFFEHYALFSAGAAGANVLYGRTLEKWIRPKFVSGILRTNIVLATGMALPELYYGHFNGKAFAINVAALGLSSVAIKGAIGGIKWVYNLKTFDKARKITSQIQKYRRFAKVGGWFYTAAETAVVLYAGEELAQAINKFLDDRAARDNVEKATKDFFAAVGNGKLTDEEFAEALGKFDGAHIDHRNYLYKKLNDADNIYFARMAKAAEEAKNLADKRKVLADKLAKFKNLRDTVLRNPKYNTVEDYLNELAARDEAKVNKDVEMYMESYNRSREETIKEIYNDNKRSGNYMTGNNATWVAQGAKVGASNDPLNGRTDWFANRSRNGIVEDVMNDARDISFNRLQAYDDQIKALEIARAASTDDVRRALIGSLINNIKEIKEKDTKLVTVKSDGASSAVEGMFGGK